MPGCDLNESGTTVSDGISQTTIKKNPRKKKSISLQRRVQKFRSLGSFMTLEKYASHPL